MTDAGQIIADTAAELGCKPDNEEILAAIARLRSAAQDVIDRWETPAWKDAVPTAEAINRLKAALKCSKG